MTSLLSASAAACELMNHHRVSIRNSFLQVYFDSASICVQLFEMQMSSSSYTQTTPLESLTVDP